MNKFKFTAETKSRSKVFVEIEMDQTLEEVRNQMGNIFTGPIILGNSFFNSSNVNYVQVEQVS